MRSRQRKAAITGFVLLALLLVSLLLGVVAQGSSFVQAQIEWLILGVLGVLLYFAILPLQRRSFVKSQCAALRASGALVASGNHSASLQDQGVKHVAPHGETMLSWDMIQQIELTDSQALVYVTALSALIIPRSGVTEGDYDAFIAALKERFDRQRSSR